MNSLLKNLMAQMESWEAANEFGIPEVSWADYDATKRSDDIYISCIACIFDALRIADDKTRISDLDALAKTLVIYSRSAASKHLKGVDRSLNLLYSAAIYYLADQPATATFLGRQVPLGADELEEEYFLRDFLSHRAGQDYPLAKQLDEFMQQGNPEVLHRLIEDLSARSKAGLHEEPRKFIAATLATFAMRRFAQTNIWKNLQESAASANPELWRPFFFNSRSFAMWELLPSQITAFRSGLLKADDQAVSLQMPTSAGKTSLCEILIFNEVKGRARRVLFLVPFRALAAEIAAGMSGRLEAAGINIIASYGGNLPTRSETTSLETADVLIITPEKFTALSQVMPDLDAKFDTVICDEGHLIDDNSRGLPYELLLTKLRSHPGGKQRKMIFMSAILPNVADIHKWLGGTDAGLARSNYKPVETDYAFLTADTGDRWKLDVNPLYPRPRSYFLNDFLTPADFRYINRATGRSNFISNRKSFASLTCATALRARHNGPVAVFTTTRGDHGIAGLAEKLLELCESGAAIAQNPPKPSDMAPLVQEYISFLLGPNYSLSRLLNHGIGFHHGQLPQEIRRIMEESIANKAISILLCTNTLAEGVNMPIRTLVVQTFRRYNANSNSYEYIANRSIKNIIGRVGRAGKETRGRIVFVNPTEKTAILAALRDVGLEPALGRLFRLITQIEEHFRQNKIVLTNEILERQNPWFLELIDSIDHSIIDLVPEGTSSDQIEQCISELLERTLAQHQSNSEAFKKTLNLVFHLRGASLQKNIPQETWPVLRKSGATPRLWKMINEAALLDSPLLKTLNDASDPEWRDQIIIPLVKLTDATNSIPIERLAKIVEGWLTGLTYHEIAKECQSEVETILTMVCSEVGFNLQDSISKFTQIAIAKHGDDELSETAQAWPSLLQYGLKTLQQLDLFERGATDRLGVWGIQRFLDEREIPFRGRDLIMYLRGTSNEVKQALAADKRVPRMCAERICKELKIR